MSAPDPLSVDKLVHRFAHRAARPGVELEDLVQVGRLAALAAANAWRPDGGASFVTFAFKCVGQEIRKAARREARRGITSRVGRFRGCREVKATLSSVDDHRDLGASTEEDIVERDALRRLHEAIRQLEPSDREIIEGRLAEMTLADIGRPLGRSREAVRQRESAAIDRLRVLLGTPNRSQRRT